MNEEIKKEIELISDLKLKGFIWNMNGQHELINALQIRLENHFLNEFDKVKNQLLLEKYKLIK